MITVVIISCGRFDLLKRTLDSFVKFNTYPIKEFIVVDDSGDKEVQYEIGLYLVEKLPTVTYLKNETNIGQVRSIDKAYAEVKTPYIFHGEDDWDFYREGFIEKSLAILEANPKIMQVWLREHYDTNGHPIESEVYTSGIASYKMVSLYFQNVWHGFTWNPGLRRLADYKLVAPFSAFIGENTFNALTECHVGQKFFGLGFRSVILTEGYVKHIGYGQQVKH